MRQLAFIKKGLVEWHEVPEPRLTAPVQVIVRHSLRLVVTATVFLCFIP
jgi:hypothetical protein